MHMHDVTSTSVAKRGYDPDTKTCHVQFNSGTTYQYEDVSPEEYKEFSEHSSPGRAIRSVFGSKRYSRIKEG